MEFKGTKGEWSLCENQEPKLRVISISLNEDVCDCLDINDAKLIAAAPEMLKALIDFKENMDRFLETDIPANAIESRIIYENAVKAINKALL